MHRDSPCPITVIQDHRKGRLPHISDLCSFHPPTIISRLPQAHKSMVPQPFKPPRSSQQRYMPNALGPIFALTSTLCDPSATTGVPAASGQSRESALTATNCTATCC